MKSKCRDAVRYSEAFKMSVVRELEEDGVSFLFLRRKYGIKGHATIQKWTLMYGNGSRGKVIRVEKLKEINEARELRKTVQLLKLALADANVDAALERAYTRLACERAGITDVEEFKKKAAGQLRTLR